MNEKTTAKEVKTVGKDVSFERIRRITGYLVGTLDRFNGYLVGTTERFNNAKRAEERDRVKHGI